jgi:tRNA(Ile)-lysidine synthase
MRSFPACLWRQNLLRYNFYQMPRATPLKKKNPMALAFESQVRSSVKSLDLEKKRVLLAVSGGADSTAMLQAFHRLKMSFAVASVDHGLRMSAAQDVEWVQALCGQLEVPFLSCKLAVGRTAGIEARARDLRYAALQTLAQRHGFDHIATAHTASDQAETLLMRLSRGSSLRGASGILPSRGDGVVRPLLSVTRSEVLGYLRALRQKFLVDPMNAELDFERVRMRRRALPGLARAHGSSRETLELNLARFAGLAQEDEQFLSAQAAELLSSRKYGLASEVSKVASARSQVFSRKALLPVAKALRYRLWVALLQQAHLQTTWRNVDECERALLENRTGTLTEDCVIVSRSGSLRIVKAPPKG